MSDPVERVDVRLERGDADVDSWTARVEYDGVLVAQYGPASPGEVLEEVGRRLDRREAKRAVELERARANR